MTDPSKALFDDYRKFYESKRLTEFIFYPPELFWSWSHAGRAGLRVLNRLRRHLNNQAHRWLFRLTDPHPMPQVFGNEVELLAVKTSQD